MADKEEREKIDASPAQALGVITTIGHLVGATVFLAPVWYLAVLPNVGFGARGAPVGDPPAVYEIKSMAVISVPRDDFLSSMGGIQDGLGEPVLAPQPPPPDDAAPNPPQLQINGAIMRRRR